MEISRIEVSYLDMLNEIAKEYNWHVEVYEGTYFVKNSQNHTVYASSNAYEVAFYMGGNSVR